MWECKVHMYSAPDGPPYMLRENVSSSRTLVYLACSFHILHYTSCEECEMNTEMYSTVYVKLCAYRLMWHLPLSAQVRRWDNVGNLPMQM